MSGVDLFMVLFNDSGTLWELFVLLHVVNLLHPVAHANEADTDSDDTSEGNHPPDDTTSRARVV